MTRLKTSDVQNISRALENYEDELIRKTGSTLLEIAEDAAQASRSVENVLKQTRAAVVPITSGGGIIEGFAQAVGAILNHIGVRATITHGADVTGIAEAYEEGNRLIFLADDRRFVAIDLYARRVVDNSAATALAYVAALEKMAKGLRAKPVLVIGIGNVGKPAIMDLIRRKAMPIAVDVDRIRIRELIEKYGSRVRAFDTVREAVRHANLIINTAPARNVLREDMIRDGMMISAPAIPVGLTQGALKKVKHHLVHDPLQLGVVTMAVAACAN